MNKTGDKLAAMVAVLSNARVPDTELVRCEVRVGHLDCRVSPALNVGDLRRLYQLDKLVWTLVEAVENHGPAFYNQDAWQHAYDALRVTLGGDAYYGTSPPKPREEAPE